MEALEASSGEGSGRAAVAAGADELDLDACVEIVCDERAGSEKKTKALRLLRTRTHPKMLLHGDRRQFVQSSMARGVIGAVVRAIEFGGVDLACEASNFLGDFIFNFESGAREVLDLFDQIAGRYLRVFSGGLVHHHIELLKAAALLCVNLAAACPSGHPRLLPLVQPVCLQIISNPSVSVDLRGTTILLLANLSTSSAQALKALGVGEALLELVTANRKSRRGQSVAESVIVFLHGNQRCREVDALMGMGLVSDYCVPLLERTLAEEEFRNMFPHLMYSARVFQVLAQSREYAQALASDARVAPLLLDAACTAPRVESDLEGKRLALEAIGLLARFRLWPQCRRGPAKKATAEAAAEVEAKEREFLERSLPELLGNDSAGIRAAAAGLWAQMNASHISLLILVGYRLDQEIGIPTSVWKSLVLSFLFPFFAGEASERPD